MTLTSEMSRITTEFETAQGARLAALAKMGTAVRREKRKNKASLAGTTAAHRAAIKSTLRDIFGTAAFLRGAADEMIERFRNEREECASDLRSRLDCHVANLRKTVGEELAHLTAARAKMARREENLRRSAMKDLRRRVEALLAGSVKLIADFNKDRARRQGLGTARAQRPAAAAGGKTSCRQGQGGGAQAAGTEAETCTRLSTEGTSLVPVSGAGRDHT